MQIVLHIGPHKTGTTAIQTDLARRFSPILPSEYWYPNPVKWGPGHAQLAWELVGLNSFQPSSEQLTSIIRIAEDAKVRGILLSSEEFSRAYPDKIERIKSVLADHEIHLLVTLNSILQRVVSEWQELVKHEHAQDLEASLSVIKGRPGLQSDLISQFLSILRPQKATVLLLSRAAVPADLFTQFARAIDVKTSKEALTDGEQLSAVQLNKSLGRIEAEILLTITRRFGILTEAMPDLDWFDVRNRFLGLFESETWADLIPRVPIMLPRSWELDFRNVATKTHSELEMLSKAGAVELVGSLNYLFEE